MRAFILLFIISLLIPNNLVLKSKDEIRSLDFEEDNSLTFIDWMLYKDMYKSNILAGLEEHIIRFGDIGINKNELNVNGMIFYKGSLIHSNRREFNENEIVSVYTSFNRVHTINSSENSLFTLGERDVNIHKYSNSLSNSLDMDKGEVLLQIDEELIPSSFHERSKLLSFKKARKKLKWGYPLMVTSINLLLFFRSNSMMSAYEDAESSNLASKIRADHRASLPFLYIGTAATVFSWSEFIIWNKN